MSDDSLAINQAKLVLAEKRTYLATLRTGIAIIALPMAVVSFLITFSKHYQAMEVLPFLVPLLLVCLIMAGFGSVLCVRSMKNLKRADRRIDDLRHRSEAVEVEFE